MPELTKEYFDKQLKNLATKQDLGRFATKQDIDSIKILVQTVQEKVKEVARMTADGLEEIKRELDVKKEVLDLNRRINRIEQALNIKL